MHSSTLNRRKLWSMSCETLFQNFAASLTPDLIVKFCRRHQIPLPNSNRGKVALFQAAHHHCHRDSPFARQLQRYLNRRHAALITQFALRQPEALQSIVESLLMGAETDMPDTLPGILWAICSDPRESVRSIEKLLIDELHGLSHCLLLAQFQGYVRIVGPEDKMPDPERETLQNELKQLQTERCSLRHEVRQLKTVETRLTRDNAQLQRKLDALQRRCEAMEKQGQSPPVANVPHNMTPRDVKKLQYELAKLTDTLREKEEETQRLMAKVSSYEAMATDIDGEMTDGQSAAPLEPEWPCFDLNGKTVALIGGLTKASIHYEEAIHQLGGSCVRHDGNAHQGHCKLAKVIRQADVVFCPVDCVSHGTATSTKKLCRTLDKPCYFLRSSGISHIREKLREVALNV